MTGDGPCHPGPWGSHNSLRDVGQTLDAHRGEGSYRERLPGEPRVVSVPTGTPSHAEKGETKLRRTPLAVNDGLTCCREVLQGFGEGRVLAARERGESEAAADHEMGFAPELALPPDHGTPGHLRGEA